MHRLVCDGTEVCWNCAVIKLTSTRQCWRCMQSPVYTTHLVKDLVLDMYVKEFLTTGRLDPAHLQTLKNLKLDPAHLQALQNSKLENERDVKPRYEESPGKVGLLEVGETCIACWSEDLVWYNGRVVEVQDRGVVVLFTDYGNSEFAEWNQVCFYLFLHKSGVQ